jgi:hypothetical protein
LGLPDLRDSKVMQDLLGLPDHRAILVQPGRKGCKVYRGIKAHKETPDPPGQLGRKVILAPPGLLAHHLRKLALPDLPGLLAHKAITDRQGRKAFRVNKDL